jgi:hypothetical protein
MTISVYHLNREIEAPARYQRAGASSHRSQCEAANRMAAHTISKNPEQTRSDRQSGRGYPALRQRHLPQICLFSVEVPLILFNNLPKGTVKTSAPAATRCPGASRNGALFAYSLVCIIR